jgi:pyridoxal phosphate enzyme (YggS family)
MTIKERIETIRERMEKAALKAGRNVSEIRLMGVSKFHDEAKITEAVNSGLLLFGESRVQEAASKFSPLKEKNPALELHMIGSLQRNKAKLVPHLFNAVQSLDREEIITALGSIAVEKSVIIEVLLELQTGEESKSGFGDTDSLARGAELALTFPGLRLCGLMTMAPFTTEEAPVRKSFRTLVSAQAFLWRRFPQTDFSCLSMGMTNDFETAIEEGSTLIRIGTAIFGDRLL